MEKEIWKPIKEWERIYEISSYGRVRRISYDNPHYKHNVKLPFYNKPRVDKDGYLKYTLCNKKINKSYMAHRLVAQAFIPNPNNYPVINHKDCDTQNNNVDNLEWCSITYNNRYIKKMGRTNYCYGGKHPKSKIVFQYDRNGNFIREYESTGEVERVLGINSAQIRACCNPKSRVKTVHNFIFKYKNQLTSND